MSGSDIWLKLSHGFPSGRFYPAALNRDRARKRGFSTNAQAHPKCYVITTTREIARDRAYAQPAAKRGESYGRQT